MKRSDDDTPMQPFEDLSEPSTFTLLSQEKSKSKGKGSVQKKKKKETLARRSFHNAWMVDSQFCYTPEQEAAILAALPGYQDGQSVVRSILRLAREYRSEVEHREEEPLPTAITAQIDHLEKCVEQLQACLWGRRGAPALHGPTLDSIEAANDEDFLGRIGKLPEENFHTLLRHLKKVLGIVQHRVWTAQRVHQTKRGRVPQNEPLLV